MNKRMYGMAPGGRLALDRAANRRRNVWFNQRLQERQREKDAEFTEMFKAATAELRQTLDNLKNLP